MTRLATAVVMTGALVLSSCGPPDASERPLPRIQQAVVEVRMTEYRLDYERPVPAGRVVFRIVNAGRNAHRLALLPLPESFPPLEAQLGGPKRRPVSPFASVSDLRPGTSDSFAVDLIPGQRYALLDFSLTPEGKPNALLGMASEFRARGRPPGPTAPTR